MGLVAGVDWSLCQRSRGCGGYEPTYQEGAPLSPFCTEPPLVYPQGFAQVRAGIPVAQPLNRAGNVPPEMGQREGRRAGTNLPGHNRYLETRSLEQGEVRPSSAHPPNTATL